jgi:hypothetical protein
MKSFIYGHIHPCRWIIITLSFKLQAPSLRFTFMHKPSSKYTLGKTCTCYDKKRQQTYNVIFIWDQKPNLNPKPNPKPFLTLN